MMLCRGWATGFRERNVHARFLIVGHELLLCRAGSCSRRRPTYHLLENRQHFAIRFMSVTGTFAPIVVSVHITHVSYEQLETAIRNNISRLLCGAVSDLGQAVNELAAFPQLMQRELRVSGEARAFKSIVQDGRNRCISLRGSIRRRRRHRFFQQLLGDCDVMVTAIHVFNVFPLSDIDPVVAPCGATVGKLSRTWLLVFPVIVRADALTLRWRSECWIKVSAKGCHFVLKLICNGIQRQGYCT